MRLPGAPGVRGEALFPAKEAALFLFGDKSKKDRAMCESPVETPGSEAGLEDRGNGDRAESRP